MPSQIKIYLFLLCLFPMLLWAQKSKYLSSDFRMAEDSLRTMADIQLNDKSEQTRTHTAWQFMQALEQVLEHPYSWKYPFDSLKLVAVLKSGKMRIFTWYVPKDNGSFAFYGMVHFFSKASGQWEVKRLYEAEKYADKVETMVLGPDEWYGALYYKIIPIKTKTGKAFTLLGWKGNNKLTTKKVIDHLVIDNKGRIKFGLPVKQDKKVLQRFIFEYSAKVVMSINYFSRQKAIVIDHLAPPARLNTSHPDLTGQFQYYGPDLSFDALLWKKGNWQFTENYNPPIIKDPNAKQKNKMKKPASDTFPGLVQ